MIDDFLEPSALLELRGVAAESQFEERPSVVNVDADGSAWRSSGLLLHRGLNQPHGLVAYRDILDELEKHSALFGDQGTQWSSVGFSFWRYPPGSRLGWHNDVREGRCGEFVLFLHESWNASWGGELLLLDADPTDVHVDSEPLSPFETVERKATQANACLTAVPPKPNRLVLMRDGTLHCIARVDRTATHERRSMTGFLATRDAGGQPSSSGVHRVASILGIA
ncbi:MAG: 2OG-Fe(II) oxygenase [Gordonia polyisoprenivorans]|nr:2OG-Fe(II) oxygenase [Gordonia polyisoprenivorans]